MIDIKFTGICENCENADLFLEKTDYYLGRIQWEVKCSHRNACTRIVALMDKDEDEE